jgi:hypothetical protein
VAVALRTLAAEAHASAVWRQWQTDESAIWQSPAVPVLAVTQRAGVWQLGPEAVSHAAPSAAGGMQVPDIPEAALQKPWSAHGT